MKVAIVMDDIAKINPKKDSSLAMMLEATYRGWHCYTFDAKDLFANKNGVYAHACQTIVFDNPNHWFEKQSAQTMMLDMFNVILMRKDPPFDINYIYSTYFLEWAEKQGVLVVNKPKSLRDANEKLFVMNFPHCMPHTLITSNQSRIKDFIKQQQTTIIKPLDGMGGHNIFKFRAGDSAINTTLKHLTDNGSTPIMAQEFLPAIVKGDKRILLIDGKPINYALARIPAKGSFKGNLAAGALGVGQPLSEHDYWLCQQIAPKLKAKGLMFVGLDVIGDYITEINVTSPTCIRELDAQFDLNIAGVLFDAIERQIHT